MTVIAWDGTTLAADRRCDFSGIGFSVTKVMRVNNALVTLIGQGVRLPELVVWLNRGANPSDYPPRQADDETALICIERNEASGVIGIRRYESTGYPLLIEDRLYADGAGRDVALAAMHCGLSAYEAIILTSKLLPAYSGLGVDTLTFDLVTCDSLPSSTPEGGI